MYIMQHNKNNILNTNISDTIFKTIVSQTTLNAGSSICVVAFVVSWNETLNAISSTCLVDMFVLRGTISKRYTSMPCIVMICNLKHIHYKNTHVTTLN